MRTLALINPNTCESTTRMMVEIARGALPACSDWVVEGITVTAGPPMITDEATLRRSAAEVLRSAVKCNAREGTDVRAIVVGAIGDPGLTDVRRKLDVPAFGLAESAILEAATGGRRFGIVTTTPGLVNAIEARVAELGVLAQYTGIRLTPGDPQELTTDPRLLEIQLRKCVEESLVDDGAEAVIIGGGPLSRAAASLQGLFQRPVLSPVQSAVRLVLDQLGN